MQTGLWRWTPVAVLVLVLVAGLWACGGSGGEEEADTEVQDCQNACNKRMRCDSGAGITPDMLNDCVDHCADASHPSAITVESAHVRCDKEYPVCEDFMACVRRVLDYEGGSSHDPFCLAWCARCRECMEEDENFSESMCQYADIDEGKRCLDTCQKRMNATKESCTRLFELFNPEQESCQVVANDSPFDQGC